MPRDHDHNRGRDAARDATAGMVEGNIGGQGVAQRHMGGNETRGTCRRADQVDGKPAGSHHERERDRARYPDEHRGNRGCRNERLKRI